MSIAIWKIALTGDLQNIKDQLQALGKRIDEPIFDQIIGYAVQANDQHLILLATLATMLSAIRFAEAAGLWRIKRWAEIISLLTSLIYIPFEIISLIRDISTTVAVILFINILIAGYLLRALLKKN